MTLDKAANLDCVRSLAVLFEELVLPTPELLDTVFEITVDILHLALPYLLTVDESQAGSKLG